MKYHSTNVFIFFSLIISTFSSCSKDEGKGGEYTIKGKIYTHFYTNNYSIKTGTEVAKDLDIYIIYGDNLGFGDKTKTNYNGEFEFKYLRTGNYKIYTYSDDTTLMSPSGEITIQKDIHLNGNTSIEDIYISKKDSRKFTKGIYSINGTVNVSYCNTYFTSCRNPVPQADIDVFIRRKSESFYFDKQSTSDIGAFSFLELPNGEYIVYTISKNTKHLIDFNEPKYITNNDTITIANGNVNTINFKVID